MISTIVLGQTYDEGFPYQMQLTSQNGGYITFSNVQIQINIRSGAMNGNLHWQENHQLLTNEFGHVEFIIGKGTSTGNGSNTNFTDIPWQDGVYYLEVLLDESFNNNFVSILNSQIMAVPFAFHSKTTSQKFSLGGLTDVDTSGIQIGDILKWDGAKWVPEVDNISSNSGCSDTVLFANSGTHSIYADTAYYAYNCELIEPVDSALFSHYADSSNFAFTANMALQSDSATYADTATYALFSEGNWGLNGNSIGVTNAFLGSTDSTDLIFKTNNTERMRILANGQIGIGTATPEADFHLSDNDGIVFTGTFGQGSIPVQGAGSRMMWYPGKAAFRAGTVSGNIWDDSNIGDYSFASGYNTRASGDYSAAFGYQASATGKYSFSVGDRSECSGDYSFSSGELSKARADYSVALGRRAETGVNDTSAIAIGYHPFANAKYSMAFGNYTVTNQPHSFAFGNEAETHHSGSFIFADNSSNSSTGNSTNTTAANQFFVKASGGAVFYTNATLTSGVTLAAGGGAWSNLSDKNVKENIESLDKDFYLSQLDSIEVTKWNYITQDEKIKHIGPMAQDFHKHFNIGNDSTRINSMDFDGINLLLLQAVYEKTLNYDNQNKKLTELEAELEKLRAERQELEGLVNQLEKKYARSSKD